MTSSEQVVFHRYPDTDTDILMKIHTDTDIRISFYTDTDTDTDIFKKIYNNTDIRKIPPMPGVIPIPILGQTRSTK